MTQVEERVAAPSPSPPTAGRTGERLRTVVVRRLATLALVVVPVWWSVDRALGDGGALVNRGGLRPLRDLLATVGSPALDPGFLSVVLHAAGVTLAFAALGTAGALVIGALGGLVLSEVAWGGRPPALVRLVRLALRAALVAARSIHELVWALLLVSVLGLDPLVGVLAIAVPFGAQTAQVFGQTLDGVPRGPLVSLRTAGVRTPVAIAYGLLPSAAPLLLSYSFYRFECAIRSTLLLGVVGVGGLGQELTVSLQSRNWDEVWTLVAAVLALSAVVDAWSSLVRRDLAVGACSEWSVETRARVQRGGEQAPLRRSRSRAPRWTRASWPLVAVGLVAAVVVADVSWRGLASARTAERAAGLLGDLWPPALPTGGWPSLTTAVLDTIAMAVLAMALAVVVTVLVGPAAMRPRRTEVGLPAATTVVWRLSRSVAWWASRTLLLVLRSVPPTVWAIVALFALFPGVLPGALALGLYTAGILGRLVAEAWESVDTGARDALRAAGVGRGVAAVTALVPPSGQQLVTYTLYRFEICVRDTAVVGIVGAAGLGRLLAEGLASFRFPVVATVLLASFAVSVASELVGRRIRHELRVGGR